MSSLGWAILFVGVALACEVGWAEHRERRSRDERQQRGRTPMDKFGLRQRR